MIAAGQVLSPLMRVTALGRLNWGWREERSIGTTGYHVARTRSNGPLLIKALNMAEENRLPRFAILIDAGEICEGFAQGQ